jgi:GDPmannose 4,6-dehydratase
VNNREAYGMFSSNGNETFVTRRIARIETGLENTLYLGNLEAKCD